MTTTRIGLFGIWILAVGQLGRDASAGGIPVRPHDESASVLEREDVRNERLYEHVVELRARDPEEYDRPHFVLSDFVSERPSFVYWVDRWEAHSARFEHWHPRFWRIIDGGMLEGGPPIIEPSVLPSVQNSQSLHDLSHHLPPDSPDPSGKPDFPPLVHPAAAVPEPASLCLLLVAFGVVVAVRGGWTILQPAGR